MRKFFYLTGIIFLGYSCNTNSYLPGFDFKLFKKTPYWELAKAVEKEDTTRIQALINVDKLEVDYAEPKFSNTLLMLAVANNKKNSVKKLLELGADPNKRSEKDNSNALLISCNSNYIEGCDTSILKLLIKYKGDVNTVQKYSYVADNADGLSRDFETTALILASEGDCPDKVKILVENGADINKYIGYEGYGAITAALVQDNLEIAKFLIIDMQAAIPKYCYIRDQGGKNEQKLTITDLLNEKSYKDDPKRSALKKEIISYLQSRGLK